MNTGTAESNYGFWAPGKENDGAMGWAFISAKRGRAWIRKDYDRGAWMYDGEADLGNGAAIRIAETILTNDPLFGWISYGGTLTSGRNTYSVVPRDGLRNRFSIITDKVRAGVVLERDGFLEGKEIVVGSDLKKISFTLENRTGDTHTTRMKVTAGGKSVRVTVDGKSLKPLVSGNDVYTFNLPVSLKNHNLVIQFQ
jgi:hypothetical protein